MSQSELLKKVIAALEASETPYMLTGSYASSMQGEPRLTHGIDLVVAITRRGVQSLLNSFSAPNYYLEPAAIESAITNKSQFNLLDVAGGDKVDFWILTEDPFDQSRFGRRQIEEFDGTNLYTSRPEDTILMKLRWAEMSGGSEKQFGDALSVYELQSETLDLDYIERWAKIISVGDLWKRILSEGKA